MRATPTLLTVVLAACVGCSRDRLRFDLQRAICPETAPEDMAAATPPAVPRPPEPPPLPTRGAADAPAAVTPAGAIERAEVEPPAAAPAAQPTPAVDTQAEVRALVAASRAKVDAITDFECQLTKREVVAGQPLPQDVIRYRFRAKPLSVSMKVLSDAGNGRELLYVAGANNNRIAVVTGKGDTPLLGAGVRTNLEVDSRDATKRSRYKVTDAGFGRTVAGLEKVLAQPGGPATVRFAGVAPIPGGTMEAARIEVALAPGADPLLPQGGKRVVQFGADPARPEYRLPVMVTTWDNTNREVEFYHFENVKLPANLPADTWDPAKLGKR